MSQSPPRSVLFACNLNSIRSPMAEGLARRRLGAAVTVASCGIWEGGYADPFMLEVMEERGAPMGDHTPRTFDEVDLDAFDLIVALTPESRARAEELTQGGGPAVEFWPSPDPSAGGETRAARLDSYRAARDHIDARLAERFGPVSTPRE